MCGYVVTSASSFGRNERKPSPPRPARPPVRLRRIRFGTRQTRRTSRRLRKARRSVGAPRLPFARHAARRHHSSCTEAFSNPAASRLRRAASGVASVMATRFAPSRAATRPARPRPAPSSTTTVSAGDRAQGRGVRRVVASRVVRRAHRRRGVAEEVAQRVRAGPDDGRRAGDEGVGVAAVLSESDGGAVGEGGVGTGARSNAGPLRGS